MVQALPVHSPSHSESQTLDLSRLQEVAPNNDHPRFAPEPPAALLCTGLIGGLDPVALGWHSNQHPVRAMAMLTWADHPGLHPSTTSKEAANFKAESSLLAHSICSGPFHPILLAHIPPSISWLLCEVLTCYTPMRPLKSGGWGQSRVEWCPIRTCPEARAPSFPGMSAFLF